MTLECAQYITSLESLMNSFNYILDTCYKTIMYQLFFRYNPSRLITFFRFNKHCALVFNNCCTGVFTILILMYSTKQLMMQNSRKMEKKCLATASLVAIHQSDNIFPF